jgi:copper chaperone CopZ
MNQVTYSIPNISCNHCVMRIKTALLKLDGVQDVEGDPESKQIRVEFDDPSSDELLRETLKEIDYPAE